MGVGEVILGGFVASLLAIAFLIVDYLIRPHIPGYFGDNAIYLLVIFLGLEFIVLWRIVVAVMSHS